MYHIKKFVFVQAWNSLSMIQGLQNVVNFKGKKDAQNVYIQIHSCVTYTFETMVSKNIARDEC